MVKRVFWIYRYSIVVSCSNLATIVLGLIYLAFPGESAFWDFSGWLFLSSWAGAVVLSLLVHQVVDLRTPIWKRINRLSYVTLAVSAVATICISVASFLLSVTILNAISHRRRLGSPLREFFWMHSDEQRLCLRHDKAVKNLYRLRFSFS